MLTLLKIGISFFAFLILDAIWFSFTAKNFYYPRLKDLIDTGSRTKILYGILLLIIYLLLSLGMYLFVLPRIKIIEEWPMIFCLSATYGLIIYGVYNLVNFTILKDWPITIVIVDTLWGSFVCGIIGLFLVWFLKQLNL